MMLIIFGIILFLSVIIYTIYIAVQKEKPEEQRPTIHASGIYSIVRRSPRGSIHPAKPTNEDIKQYLASVRSDAKDRPLSESAKSKLLADWERSLDANIATIEEGDRSGMEIYFYECPKSCSQNGSIRGQSKFVTREEMYRHPELIPPLHLGCTCRLVPDTDWRKGANRTADASPLLDGNKFIQPNWKTIE